jgi:hypothetical protein
MRVILVILCLWGYSHVSAQYDPAGGEPGSLAIPVDHPVTFFGADSAWIERGWQEIEDTTIGKVTHGTIDDALGLPDRQVVSLGDGGSITLFFRDAIEDRSGFDFVVFENGFKVGEEYYLELAFVEVSSDGKNYKRFPAISLTDTMNQVGGFETLQPTQLSGFAGKHQGGYGTPFDLAELEMDSIHFIRLIDVVGKVDRTLGSTDSRNQIINDPYPTPGPSGGFDLDAVVVPGETLSVEDVAGLVRTNAIRVAKGYELDREAMVYTLDGRKLSDSEYYRFTESGLYVVYFTHNHHVSKRLFSVY